MDGMTINHIVSIDHGSYTTLFENVETDHWNLGIGVSSLEFLRGFMANGWCDFTGPSDGYVGFNQETHEY
jgi:hypothetical protein